MHRAKGGWGNGSAWRAPRPSLPMAATRVAVPARRRNGVGPFLHSLVPAWSRPAAYRAARATLVIPTLFAVCSRVIGNDQMALYASFGGFATLVLASFGGSRRERFVAHMALTATASLLIVVGTAVSGSDAVAAIVAFVAALCVLFCGLIGPNVVSGATAVLLAFVLPASSPGLFGTVPWRLAGWLLASAAGTIAVMLSPPPPAGDRVRSSAAASASALAEEINAGLRGEERAGVGARATDAKVALHNAFIAAPLRPIGIAAADQALADLVETLQLCTSLCAEVVGEMDDMTAVDDFDRRLLAHTSRLLRDTGTLLAGGEVTLLVGELDELVRESAGRIADFCRSSAASESAVYLSFRARRLAGAVRNAAADALIVTRRADRQAVTAERARWQGGAGASAVRWSRAPGFDALKRRVGEHAGLRSVWFLNSLRGALALTAAVVIARELDLQHAFWVVLGAISVLRTNAASTGATALRALAGTAAGFVVGSALMIGIAGHTGWLWAALPVAVLVSAYAPGTALFAVGQAAFTVFVIVLFNIIVPLGWRVGVIRVEDVALGVGVSTLAGLLFWPRGANKVMCNDLADSFHADGLYLVRATAWALGLRDGAPTGETAVRASVRLGDALRAFIAEQGTKHVPKQELWKLVGGERQLRLSAQSLASVPKPEPLLPATQSRLLLGEAVRIAGLSDDLAAKLGMVPATVAQELDRLPELESPQAGASQGFGLWVGLHLDHVRGALGELGEPAAIVATVRARPWWR
jgi:uncharacterized membrane protein YccC